MPETTTHFTDDPTRRQLTAVIDRIIPADDFPSASQAGVLNYLDRALAGDAGEHADIIAEGLRVIDSTARNAFDRPFVECNEKEQDAVLTDVETEPFFRRLVELTSEGYYADPGNGGNVNAVSWRMMGFDPNGQDGARS